MEEIIAVKNVSKSFGGVKANIDISLKVKKGLRLIFCRKQKIIT